MTVNLDREDIISLLKGTAPYFSIMHEIPSDLGRFCAGMCDIWEWTISKDCKYTDEELLAIYYKCKESYMKP